MFSRSVPTQPEMAVNGKATNSSPRAARRYDRGALVDEIEWKGINIVVELPRKCHLREHILVSRQTAM